MAEPFTLDPALERDSFFICDYPLCQIRLMDHAAFPWLLLIPRRAGCVEWIDLEREDQHHLSEEIAIISHLFQALVTPDKLNIAALGNQVRQLHVHLIGRYRDDPAWPNPVWGRAATPYEPESRTRFIQELKTVFESAM